MKRLISSWPIHSAHRILAMPTGRVALCGSVSFIISCQSQKDFQLVGFGSVEWYPEYLLDTSHSGFVFFFCVDRFDSMSLISSA